MYMIIIVRHYRVTRRRFRPYNILWYLWRMRKYYIIRVDALSLNTLERLSRCAMNMTVYCNTQVIVWAYYVRRYWWQILSTRITTAIHREIKKEIKEIKNLISSTNDRWKTENSNFVRERSKKWVWNFSHFLRYHDKFAIK